MIEKSNLVCQLFEGGNYGAHATRKKNNRVARKDENWKKMFNSG